MPGTDLIELYKDSDILAIHKPEGIAFHCDDAGTGIVKRVREQYAEDALYPVHRLD